MTEPTTNDVSWPLAAKLARRELRGSLRSFRIFLACLALGVAAIAAVGSTRAMLEESISSDAREILGGDVLVDIVHRPATEDERDAMAAAGTQEVREHIFTQVVTDVEGFRTLFTHAQITSSIFSRMATGSITSPSIRLMPTAVCLGPIRRSISRIN